MRQQSYLAYPLSDHIMIRNYVHDPSLDVIHHQTLRCILSLYQAKHQKPITCIFSFDLTLHKIFITCVLSPLIFSFLYNQILCQYLKPKPLMTNTLDQIPRVNTSDQIPWTQNTLDQNLGFPPCTLFSSYGSACIRILSFCSVDQHVYILFTKRTRVYFLNYFTSTFSFTFFILISRPQFHLPILLYHCPITSEQTCYIIIFHITSQLIPLNCPTFFHICKQNYHAFYHI